MLRLVKLVPSHMPFSQLSEGILTSNINVYGGQNQKLLTIKLLVMGFVICCNNRITLIIILSGKTEIYIKRV